MGPARSIRPCRHTSPSRRWLSTRSSSNPTAHKPTWTRRVATKAFHTGSIWTIGFECVGSQGQGYGNAPLPGDRRELDFFGSAMLPDGAIAVPFGMDRPNGTDQNSGLLRSNMDLYLAAQRL